jgi:hypothetical protein
MLPMKRKVEPEILDDLRPSDHRAIGSRQDLQRLNVWMGQARIMARVLTGTFTQRPPRSIVELGAGDGTQLLRLARRIAHRWHPLRVVMVDRHQLVSSRTKAEFKSLSWDVESVEMDVFDWLRRPKPERTDLTIANLFLHHFKDGRLRKLLCHTARQTGFFLTCEPRRDKFSFCGASLVGVIGCNGVTRHDAKASVRAGFAENELSALWPAGKLWKLTERQAGLFTHCFLAQRIDE